MGAEVVLAARWRPKSDITSRLDSLTPILCRRSIEMFSLSLTVQKLLECIDLAGNLAFRFQNLGFSGGFDDPEINATPERHFLQQTASFEPSRANRLSLLGCRGIQEQKGKVKVR
jgi:hypothetical protein